MNLLTIVPTLLVAGPAANVETVAEAPRQFSAQTVEGAQRQVIAPRPPNLTLDPSWGQEPAPSNRVLDDARALRRSGIAVTLLGIGLEVTALVISYYAGVIHLAAELNGQSHPDMSSYEIATKVCGMLGAGALAAGISAWVIGSRRMRAAEQKASVAAVAAPGTGGFVVRFMF